MLTNRVFSAPAPKANNYTDCGIILHKALPELPRHTVARELMEKALSLKRQPENSIVTIYDFEIRETPDGPYAVGRMLYEFPDSEIALPSLPRDISRYTSFLKELNQHFQIKKIKKNR